MEIHSRGDLVFDAMCYLVLASIASRFGGSIINKASVSIFYLAVEAITTVVSVWAFIRFCKRMRLVLNYKKYLESEKGEEATSIESKTHED